MLNPSFCWFKSRSIPIFIGFILSFWARLARLDVLEASALVLPSEWNMSMTATEVGESLLVDDCFGGYTTISTISALWGIPFWRPTTTMLWLRVLNYAFRTRNKGRMTARKNCDSANIQFNFAQGGYTHVFTKLRSPKMQWLLSFSSSRMGYATVFARPGRIPIRTLCLWFKRSFWVQRAFVEIYAIHQAWENGTCVVSVVVVLVVVVRCCFCCFFVVFCCFFVGFFFFVVLFLLFVCLFAWLVGWLLLFVVVCRCLSLFVVVCRCLSLFVVVCRCLSLFVVVCGCLWLFVVVCGCLLLLFVVVCCCCCLLLFVVVCRCLSLFVVVCCCLLLFVVCCFFFLWWWWWSSSSPRGITFLSVHYFIKEGLPKDAFSAATIVSEWEVNKSNIRLGICRKIPFMMVSWPYPGRRRWSCRMPRSLQRLRRHRNLRSLRRSQILC